MERNVNDRIYSPMSLPCSTIGPYEIITSTKET